ncbi:HlyD family secretion protein (plasmid) [Rhizobium leguminosarum]|uniref:HlyD family secretion protein n=1 Tax=Rhizobium leguminosarum TaxID=384 RepID=UPI001440F0AB|nr:HlyD family secretion protein [Rhizobium leguminosarum]MBY5496050.1 HlyD family secretion protein [Rhizobium leguminosarum]NKK91107.1 HlyD family efflux transporter periplasmic adaptor subunit [Rhizobium leguminosarum bv. viciae]
MLQQTPVKGSTLASPKTSEQHQLARPRGDYTKVLVPLLVVGAVCVLAGLSSQQWDRWTSGADEQTTDNAYVRSELSHLSARASGNVVAVKVGDFEHVKAGDVILQIDPSDYEARRDQAKATLGAAVAQRNNLDNQGNLQKAEIRRSEAQAVVARANADLAKIVANRQTTLLEKGAGAQQRLDEATANEKTTSATAGAAEAAVASAEAQLQYIDGQRAQLSANVESAKASLRSAELALSYTTILAPFDGIVSERQVHVGDYITAGTNAISIIPLPNVYLIANFKETQLFRMQEGQAATVTVDSLPGQAFTGKVTRLSPASGSQFALLPADNATGNFTKVVQRIPVRIDFNGSSALDRLRSGMSAVVTVSVASNRE